MAGFSTNNFIHQTLRSLNPLHNAANLTNPRRAFKEAASGFAPDAPPVPPAAPQIDEAAQSIAESDRLRRRRGVYANIYAGATPAAPLIGKTTLGG